MKTSVLIENTTQLPHFQAEHGLSFCLETKEHCILFDMGQTGNFANNAEKLGIDLQKVDIAILSHGHYDHGGGLETFLELNKTAKIYLSKYAFDTHFSKERNIGLNALLKDNPRFVFVDNFLEIDESIKLHSCNALKAVHPIINNGFRINSEKPFISDNFKHEIYLSIAEDEKSILISGCSHKNILNIMDWFKPQVLIGGFHFRDLNLENENDIEYLNTAAKKLLTYNTKYYTCHCTGEAQFKHVKKIMQNTITYISTGEVFYV